MSEKKYSVYIHVNKSNNKAYVGATSNKPENRFSNGLGYKLNKEFYSDILHYGWDGFTHNVLYTNLTKEQADLKERELIEKYKTTDSNFGYNKSKGGILPKKIINNNGQSIVTATVIIDDVLLHHISILAKKHHRSRNGEILCAIQTYLDVNNF